MEQIDVAEKITDERRRRVMVHVAGRAGLFDPAFVHHNNAIGHFERFLLVVRDKHAGDVNFIVQAAQPAAQFLADLGIERTKWFIKQQHTRLHGERAGKRDALALAAGELRGVAFGHSFEAHGLTSSPARDR